MGKRPLSDKNSSVGQANMSWSDSQTCVDMAGKSERNTPLLRDVPPHRRVSVLWKRINAYVPVFNAHPTLKQQLGLSRRDDGESKMVQV
jgi:hypothetical protein